VALVQFFQHWLNASVHFDLFLLYKLELLSAVSQNSPQITDMETAMM
jgi:hypothetical protein